MLYIKLIWMNILAITTVLIIYPILHELGHCLMAYLVGAEILEMSVFPASYVAVELPCGNVPGQVLIGMAGILFPMIIGLVKPRRLTGCIIVYTLWLTNTFACFFGCAAIVAKVFGWLWGKQDVLAVTACVGGGDAAVFAICVALLAVYVYAFVKERPLRKIMLYFH